MYHAPAKVNIPGPGSFNLWFIQTPDSLMCVCVCVCVCVCEKLGLIFI